VAKPKKPEPDAGGFKPGEFEEVELPGVEATAEAEEFEDVDVVMSSLGTRVPVDKLMPAKEQLAKKLILDVADEAFSAESGTDTHGFENIVAVGISEKTVRNHASNYIEVIVAGVEAVLLIFVAVPLWAKAAEGFPPESKSTVVQIVAQQFNWNVRYPGKDSTFGKQDMHFVNDTNLFGIDPGDAKGKDDVQMAPAPEIHVPVNKPVIAYISSKDVIHSFKVIAMRVTQDAIPGMRIPIWFVPTKVGHYQINCAQLCGNGHSAMANGMLIVESQEDFNKWIEAKSKSGGAQSLE